jgi:hypothetical protein
MVDSIYNKVITALKQAEKHNSSIMVKPEVILWPDPEELWTEVIPILQEDFPQIITYGSYIPEKKQGPSIWIKCMIARSLPEADWTKDAIPILYMPGVSKNDLRNVEHAKLEFQPLLEYQYTGTMFVQENGREWTILAFVENNISGLGLRVTKDSATKNALKKSLPQIFRDPEILFGKTIIDADFLNNQLFPDIYHNILKWMCKGHSFIDRMDSGKRDIFFNICKTQYGFTPDYKNIISIAEKLGTQRNHWKYVWQMYATAPKKYPEIKDLLRSAKPDDLGEGVFAIPDESWPQLNEQKENELRSSIAEVAKLSPDKAVVGLHELEYKHSKRRNWVWYELDQSPINKALPFLCKMSQITTESFPSLSIDDLTEYYISQGYEADQTMRNALASVKTENDKAIVKELIGLLYSPWLDSLTKKFQDFIEKDPSIFTRQKASEETESFILFVDAFRYELAIDFVKRLSESAYKFQLNPGWSSIPTVTPTAKPNVSPMAESVSETCEIKDFRPQLKNGKDLQHAAFKESLKSIGFEFIKSTNTIIPENKYWMEIGDIDTKGHEEQSGLVKRVEELFDLVQEVIDGAFEKGVKRIKIVTDHGWQLLPGGLPKTHLYEGLAETRWGRCALIKEGAKTDLLHLPWRWNPAIFIAYAPGISFFKANQEYAHGGISIQECLVPELTIEKAAESGLIPKIKFVKWVNLKCAVEIENAGEGFQVDIRTKFSDESTTIVISRNKEIIDNKGSVMVSDEAESQAATVVLLDSSGKILDKQATTVGG